jgi:hypothetical protein
MAWVFTTPLPHLYHTIAQIQEKLAVRRHRAERDGAMGQSLDPEITARGFQMFFHMLNTLSVTTAGCSMQQP